MVKALSFRALYGMANKIQFPLLGVKFYTFTHCPIFKMYKLNNMFTIMRIHACIPVYVLTYVYFSIFLLLAMLVSIFLLELPVVTRLFFIKLYNLFSIILILISI